MKKVILPSAPSDVADAAGPSVMTISASCLSTFDPLISDVESAIQDCFAAFS